MIHDDSHDPLRDYRDCWICHEALSATWVWLADQFIGPNPGDDRDWGDFIRLIREHAAGITRELA